MTTKFKKLYDKYKVMLIVATMLGACIYGYVFINKIGNPDKYFFGEYVIGGGWELSLGRFFLGITQKMRYGMNMPIFLSMVAVFVFALSGMVLCEILEIERSVTAFAIILMTVAAPKVMSTIICYSCSDVYSIAFFAIMLMFYFMRKACDNRRNQLIKTLCCAFIIALSLGIYQSGINEMAALTLLMLIVYCINNDIAWIKKIANIIMMDILAVILYYIMMKSVLKIFNIPLGNYKGIENFSIINIIYNLPHSVVNCYEHGLNFFFGHNVYSNSFGIIKWNVCITIITILSLILLMRLMKETWRKVVVIVAILLLPVAATSMELIVNTPVEILQSDGLMLIFPLFIKIVEFTVIRLEGNSQRISRICWGASIAILFIISFKNTLITNADAFAMQYQNKQAIEVGRRIIKDYEAGNYPKEYKLDILGVPTLGNYKVPEYLLKNANYLMKVGAMWSDKSSVETWNRLISEELGIVIEADGRDRAGEIGHSQQFIDAPCYPEEGSIFIDGDTVVVKVSPIT